MDQAASSSSSAGGGSGTAAPAIPSLRRERSNVWDIFKKITDGGKVKAFCTLCKKNLAYNGSTTSNLRDHMDWHKKQSAKLNPATTPGETKPQQVTLDMLMSPNFSRPCPFPKATRITDLLAKWCWRDGRPMSIVSDSGLQELVHFFEPGYEFPSSRHIAKLIKLSYSDAVDKLVALLGSATTISLTCDGWTSKATDSYVTVTAHMLTDDWNIRSCVVQCAPFEGSHTGERLASLMHETMSRFKVPDEKVVVVVHDEASNEVLAGKLLLQRYGWRTYVCSAHRLQNAIKYSLTRTSRSLSHLVASCRRVVGHFNHSALEKQALIKKQDCARPVTLVHDCATRWNSVYYMIKRLVRLRDPVTSLLGANRDSRHLQLAPAQWDLAEDVVEVLNSLEHVTTELSGELYATLSCVYPLLHGLYTILKPKASGEHGAVKAMKNKLRQQLEERFGFPVPSPSSLPVLASALDPRFRRLKYISSPKRAAVRDVLVEAASAGTFSSKHCPTPAKEVKEEVDEPPAKRSKPDPFLKSLLRASCKENDSSDTDTDDNSGEDVGEEVDRFLGGKNIDYSMDPLAWWRGQSSSFPRLAVLAREVLSVPATSAPSERVFSLSGLITDKRRCGLKPDFVNALVFLHRNAKVLGLVKEDPVKVLPLQPLFAPPAVNDDNDEPQLPQLYDLATTAADEGTAGDSDEGSANDG